MKRILAFAVCTVLIAACLIAPCFSGNTEQAETQRMVLAQFPFSEAAFNAGSLMTGFVYNDGLLFLDNETLSPELAKVSMGLAAAAYDWSNLESALSQMPGFAFDDYLETAANRKGNWGRTHTAADNDFVRYAIAAKSVDYNDET